MRNPKDEPVFDNNYLKDRRIELKMSVYRLSELSGIQRSKIHKLEKGDTPRPVFDTVTALAEALNTTTDAFNKRRI